MTLLDSYFPNKKFAKYKNKKEVPKTKGEGTATVYEYSDRQISRRNNQKAEKIKKLEGSIGALRSKVKTDLKSSDEKTFLVALAVGLIDHIYERVGNDDSSKNGHFGVTGFKPSHVTFQGSNATIKYTGKSGVDHVKKVTDKALVAALKRARSGDKDCLFDCSEGKVRSSQVNKYLAPFDITAKDIRGFHANREMRDQLKKLRSENGTLPKSLKEKKEQLKEEFRLALEQTAKAVGHEASTLRNQYLVPGLEDEFLTHGTTKKTASLEELYFKSTPYKEDPKIAALYFATKSKSEKIEEKVEALVKPMPKKKPPRKDLRNERVREDDSDIEYQGAEADKDLSLNYKRVAKKSPSLIEQFLKEVGDKKVLNPETKNKVKVKSLRGAEGRAGDLFNTEFENWKGDKAGEEESSQGKPTKRKPTKRKPTKRKPTKRKPTKRKPEKEEEPEPDPDPESEDPPSLEDLVLTAKIDLLAESSPEKARNDAYALFQETSLDDLEAVAERVEVELAVVERLQKGLDASSPKYKELQSQKSSLEEAQFGAFVSVVTRGLDSKKERDLMKALGYDPSPQMGSLIHFLNNENKISEILDGGSKAWSGPDGRLKVKSIYDSMSETDFIRRIKQQNKGLTLSIEGDGGKGEKSEVHLADYLQEGYCPPSNPLNADYLRRNPDGKDCPVKIPKENREILKEFLIDLQTDSMVAYNAIPEAGKEDMGDGNLPFPILDDEPLFEGKAVDDFMGGDPEKLKVELGDKRLNVLKRMALNGVDDKNPSSILLKSISEGESPVSALSEATDPPLNIMGKTSSVNSLYHLNSIEVPCLNTMLYGKRSLVMKKMSRQDTKVFTSNLDKIANLIQKKGHLIGIPKKVAMDFAYRCDLISDAAERHVGLKNAGIETEIGEDESEHGFTQTFDELENLVESGTKKKSYLNSVEEDVDDLWEDY